MSRHSFNLILDKSYDENVSSLANITTPHQQVHKGHGYYFSYLDESVADNGTLDVMLSVGSNKHLHTIFRFSSGGDAYGYILENPSVSASVTTIPIYNMNRASSNTTDAIAYATPTTTGGTSLVSVVMPGGGKQFSIGGATRNGAEWILKKDRNYVFRVVNKGGAAKAVSFDVEWYEV